ncbi:MAG: DUF2975 domain-containing protein, partial [Alphaproteobacteria bacterium]|nr:DUF2975 domain-containing protein [Alphaproteobacteria bacterium]
MTTLPSSAMARIRTIARTMKYVIGTGLCLTATALVAVWGVPELTNAFVLSLNLTPDQVTLSNSAGAGGALIMLVPFSVLFLLLLRAFSLFRLYEQGEIFAASAIHQLRKIASGLISLAVLSPVTRTLLVLDLTLG